MSPTGPIRVTGKDGWQGTIEAGSRALLGTDQQVAVRLADGRELWVPGAGLELQPDGSYYLPLAAGDFGRPNGEEIRVPVVEEQLDVQKRQVESGRVRVKKTVIEEDAVIDEPLYRHTVDIQRVAIGRQVDGPVAVRYEGDTMIIPVLEEVLVVEKRLVLREELRVTRQRTEVREVQHVPLRKEEVDIERVDGVEESGTNSSTNYQEEQP